MDNAKILEIQSAAAEAAKDAIKAQIAKGAPRRGMDKTRHAAVVAYVIVELTASFMEEGEENPKGLLRAAFSGNLLNASALRQDMEKAGILEKQGVESMDYAV